MGPPAPILVQRPKACPPVWEIRNLPGKMKKFHDKELADKTFEECLKAHRKAMKEERKTIAKVKEAETSFKAKDAIASNSSLTKEKVKSSLSTKGILINEGKMLVKENKPGGKTNRKERRKERRKNLDVGPITEVYAHGCCIDHGTLSDGTPNFACGVGVYMEPQHEATTLQTVSEPWDTRRPNPPKAALRAAYLALEMASNSGCKVIMVKMSHVHTVKSLSGWTSKWYQTNGMMPRDAIIVNYEELERIANKRNELIGRGIKIRWSVVDENDPKNKLAVSLARGGAQEKLNNVLATK